MRMRLGDGHSATPPGRMAAADGTSASQKAIHRSAIVFPAGRMEKASANVRANGVKVVVAAALKVMFVALVVRTFPKPPTTHRGLPRESRSLNPVATLREKEGEEREGENEEAIPYSNAHT